MVHNTCLRCKYQFHVWLGHRRRAFDHFLSALGVFLIVPEFLLSKFQVLLVQFRLDLAPVLDILLDLLQGGASLLIVPFFCHLETYDITGLSGVQFLHGPKKYNLKDNLKSLQALKLHLFETRTHLLATVLML